MEYTIGIVLALVIALLAKILEFDTDRSFYPVILIVIAMYYVLFAVMNESTGIIITELIIALVFMTIAMVGARVSLFIIAVGLIAHGVFDIFHNRIITNLSVPAWWPGFCAAVDVVLGLIVLFIAKRRSNKSFQPTASGPTEVSR